MTRNKNYYFVSENWDQKETLLIIIQGSGGVRAGIWSRSVCRDDSLKTGSMIPYVDRAVKLAWGVIILNPNELNNPEFHVHDIMENVVLQNPKKQKILIVAHSYGGTATLDFLITKLDTLESLNINGIAFTDSVHYIDQLGRLKDKNKQNKILDFLGSPKCCDWVGSDKPLDTLIAEASNSRNGCKKVSAGHSQHEYTSGFAFESVFKLLQSC